MCNIPAHEFWRQQHFLVAAFTAENSATEAAVVPEPYYCSERQVAAAAVRALAVWDPLGGLKGQHIQFTASGGLRPM